MTNPRRRFDGYLQNVAADKLRSMSRLWGTSGALRKGESMQAISEGLNDPAQVRAAWERLGPYERMSLAILKQWGGEMDATTLALALRVSGVALPRERHYDRNYDLIEPLVTGGLVLSRDAYDPTRWSSPYAGSDSSNVFADERLLQVVEEPQIRPFALNPAPPPQTSHHRAARLLILDILDLLRALERLGGLDLTKAGLPKAPSVRKLQKALGWKRSDFETGGSSALNTAGILPALLIGSQLLMAQGQKLVLRESTEQFASRSPEDQASCFLKGLPYVGGWDEPEDEWHSQQPYRHGRVILVLVLAALPTDRDDFFTLADFEQAVYERVGEHFALTFIPRPPEAYRQKEENFQQRMNAWRQERRQSWRNQEFPWFVKSLSSWAYYLGLVELGMADDRLSSVRLTPFGRAVLHRDLAAPPQSFLSAPAEEARAAWIVQPNFEIVVYLDHALPLQLALLERVADRVQIQQHVAHYRLTREAAYRALENGLTVEQIVVGLQNGSGAPLPQNVQVEIREWASLHERILLWRSSSLLEFADQQARDVAIQEGLDGTAVGERFVRLPSGNGLDDRGVERWVKDRVNYSAHLPACLKATESGELTLASPIRDLLLAARLDRCAERIDARKWRLTAASVAAARKAGWRIRELLDLLQERLTDHFVPPLLDIALRAWAGAEVSVEMETVTILSVSDEPSRQNSRLFEALVSSAELRPYLRGSLGMGLFVVASSQVEAFKARLAAAGIQFRTLSVGPMGDQEEDDDVPDLLDARLLMRFLR